MPDNAPISLAPGTLPSQTPGPIPVRNALTSRTFFGLLIAQFLAAFNDQAIHAAAMFYAINTRTLTERDAISLMPILFYAPWAIFCTIAGHLADRYSKRTALVTWKLVEVGITAVALLGFWMGRSGFETTGPWLVLATVFLMGTHSAFFVPAKYGVMPEILPPHQLSKGNGLLESLSFLAVILGTVCGGVLSYLYQRQEWIIGAILFSLALVGAAASLLIRKMPAANPYRPFPAYIYGPIIRNLRTLLGSRPLRLAVVGIAFFTFVVAFMRAAVYMLGESQNPRWDELKTSAVVGTVALGIGLGSPLAGWLSGRRVELRLVPVGALGMILACVLGAYFIDQVPALVLCIVAIGFGTGFYIVPLFTLLQHKAPREQKGDLIATSNFINISGAITASFLFFAVVYFAQVTGLVPEVKERGEVAGELVRLDIVRGRPVYFEIVDAGQTILSAGRRREEHKKLTLPDIVEHIFSSGNGGDATVIKANRDVRLPQAGDPGPGQRVSVSGYDLGGVAHFEIVPEGQPPTPDYDRRRLPRFLFLGAAGLTLLMLVAIMRSLIRVRQEES
jgi:MFS family permease